MVFLKDLQLRYTPRQNRYNWLAPLAGAGVLVIGVLIGMAISRTGQPLFLRYEGQASPRAGQIDEILSYIQQKYVTEVDGQVLSDKAIEALLEGLDPYTYYIPADEVAEMQGQMEGAFDGIGIEFIDLGDTIGVTNVLPDAPAVAAGLRKGDRIVGINGQRIAGQNWSLEETVRQLKGPRDSQVSLAVLRKGSDLTDSILITRGPVRVPAVMTAYMLDSITGYIKLIKFNNNAYKDYMTALEQLSASGNLRHLVIDLRDNPGGYLQEAVNLLSQLFKEKGRLLVYTQGEHYKKTEYKTTGKVFFPVEHVCVLINKYSASASEIVAGAIQDLDRGVIIGETSFGKGMVQEQFNLKNGAALRLTVAEYYTPSGRSINKAVMADSMHTARKDSTAHVIFRTARGREVASGGGIVPDVLLPRDSFWEDSLHYPLFEAAHKFVFNRFAGKAQIKHNDPNWEEELLHSFGVYIGTKPALKDAIQQPDLEISVKRFLVSKMLWYSKGPEASMRYLNQQDEAVERALNEVKDNDQKTLKSGRAAPARN